MFTVNLRSLLLSKSAWFILVFSLAGFIPARDLKPSLILSQSLSDRPAFPVVQVEIDHAPYTMILDTGTSNTLVLDPTLGTKMQISDRSESFTIAGGLKIQRKVGSIPMVKFGANNLSNVRTVQVDLQPFRDFLGMDYYGIVPASFFSNQILRFDFDKAVLEVFDGEAVISDEWTELPIEIHEDRPCLRLRISSEDVLFLIDTGFNSALEIPSVVLPHLLNQGEAVVNPVAGKGLDAAGSLKAAEIGWFKQGEMMGKSLEGVEFRTSDGRAKIGMSWLVAFNFIIDMKGKKFLYAKRAAPRIPVAMDLMVGAAFRYTKVGLVIDRLRPGGGAAENAGLKVGDLIIQIGSDPALPLDGPHIYDLIEKSGGAKLPCIYRRAEKSEPTRVDLEIGQPESPWNFGGYRP